MKDHRIQRYSIDAGLPPPAVRGKIAVIDRQVRWKLHLISPPEKVYEMFATDSGRSKFWPEGSVESDGQMTLRFLGEEQSVSCKIIEKTPPKRFSFHYFGNTTVTVEFERDEKGGTDLLLTEIDFPSLKYWEPNNVGWVTVLMNLKAAVDFGVDLRNHDRKRTWNDGYCET